MEIEGPHETQPTSFQDLAQVIISLLVQTGFREGNLSLLPFQSLAVCHGIIFQGGEQTKLLGHLSVVRKVSLKLLSIWHGLRPGKNYSREALIAVQL